MELYTLIFIKAQKILNTLLESLVVVDVIDEDQASSSSSVDY